MQRLPFDCLGDAALSALARAARACAPLYSPGEGQLVSYTPSWLVGDPSLEMDGRLGRLYMGEPSRGRPPTRGRGGAFRAMRIEPEVRYGFSMCHPGPGPEKQR
eukprot:861820-Pyramimonas_sp.AAC.1